MAFGIIRARNLSAGDIASTDKHNARRYSSEKEYPENIKVDGRNEALYQTEKHEDYLYKDEITLQEALDIRLKENNVKGIRKNSNVAIEYVCTINDKKAWNAYSFEGYVSNTQTWIEDRHGKNSVIATYKHEDESNPHVHFVVVPLEEKVVKWKNKQGSGERKETRLNTRDFTGGRDKLRGLQDDYFQHLGDRYGLQGEKLGVPLFRGTKVEFQHKEYSNQTDHELGVLRDELSQTNDQVLKLGIELEIARKNAEKLKKEGAYQNEIKKSQEYKRKNWQNKGVRDNQTIFHTEEPAKKTKSKGRKI